MDLNQDTRARIFAVANALYEEGGRNTFPTVDAVRRAAKVDMNAASLVMREWRRMQTAAPAPAAVAVPDRLRQAQDSALAALWAEAQEIANEALKAAQSAWDAERAEAEALRAELAAAFEGVRSELEVSTTRLADVERELPQLRDALAATTRQLQEVDDARVAAENRASIAEQRADELANRVADLKEDLGRTHSDRDRLRAELDRVGQAADDARAAAESRASIAERRADELADRIADLKEELGRTHSDRDRLRAELDRVGQAADAANARIASLGDELATVKARALAEHNAHQEQRKAAAQEVQRSAERLTKAQTERDQAWRDLGVAREAAARLTGQVEALQTQYATVKQLAVESVAAAKGAPSPTSKRPR